LSKKIALQIGGRQFDVDVDDVFAIFLQKQMEQDFNMEGNNDLKTMLQGYVRKTHELYTQNKKIEVILKKVEK
jgi:hypothetical protein